MFSIYFYSSRKFVREITARKALVTSEGRDICLDLHDMTVDPMDETHPGMARATRFTYRVTDALKDGQYKRKEKDFRFREMTAAIARARQAVADFSESHIQTLDSYRSSVVRQAANRYGIRPDFASADSTIDIQLLALQFVLQKLGKADGDALRAVRHFAGAGGVLYASAYPQIDPTMGYIPGLKAFVAAVLGGIGIIPGAMLGGIVIGMVESFTTSYISSSMADTFVFLILIVVLVIKPAGILGKNVGEKV